MLRIEASTVLIDHPSGSLGCFRVDGPPVLATKEKADMARLHGILPAMVTPFTVDDRVDEAATRNLVQSLLDAGVHGLIPTGSTGEFSAIKWGTE